MCLLCLLYAPWRAGGPSPWSLWLLRRLERNKEGEDQEVKHEALYNCMIGMFGAENAGIIECVGDENKTEAALAKAEEFGKSL